MNALTGREFFWTLLFLIILVLGLGMTSVWMNIERMDLAYDLKRMETELDQKTALVTKLEVERNNLSSPYRLKKLAEKYDLRPAVAGQIRRIDESNQKAAENGG